MIITCFVIKPWSHANNNNNICKLSTNLHSCTLGTSPLPPREFPFLRPLWWVVSQTLGANLLFGHLGHLRRWLEQAGGCVHHLGRVCEMWSTAASPVVSPTSQSSLNLQLAHRAPSVSPRHPVCCSVQLLCATVCSYVKLCAAHVIPSLHSFNWDLLHLPASDCTAVAYSAESYKQYIAEHCTKRTALNSSNQ